MKKGNSCAKWSSIYIWFWYLELFLVDTATAQSSMHLLASSARSICCFAFRLRVYRFQSSSFFIPIFHFIYELFWLFSNSLAWFFFHCFVSFRSVLLFLLLFFPFSSISLACIRLNRFTLRVCIWTKAKKTPKRLKTVYLPFWLFVCVTFWMLYTSSGYTSNKNMLAK